ncbi:MAG: DUF4296 domain-containing protein [Muribaculaceae bacterium]|nr:DUF4296 domain-containing protein [Muribaculaceae bacterium]
MPRILKISFLLSIILLIGGCKKRPQGVISDSQMESLMTDLLLMEAYANSPEAHNLPDSVKQTLGEAVLKAHGVDRAQLDSTYSWYARNVGDYYRIYEKVERNLAKQRKKAGIKVSDDDQNNIWTLPRHLMLSPLACGNSLTFNLPGETMSGGELLRWKMKMNSASSVDVLIGIDYTDGTGSINRREFQGGNIDMTIIADTALTPRRIYGFISASRRDLPLWIDSISLSKNPYDSITYSGITYQRKINPTARIIPKKEEPGPQDSVRFMSLKQ